MRCELLARVRAAVSLILTHPLSTYSPTSALYAVESRAVEPGAAGNCDVRGIGT